MPIALSGSALCNLLQVKATGHLKPNAAWSDHHPMNAAYRFLLGDYVRWTAFKTAIIASVALILPAERLLQVHRVLLFHGQNVS